MRLIILTALYPPAVGGAATYFGDIVCALAQRPDIEQLAVLTERMPGQPIRQSDGARQVLRYLPTRISLPQRSWPIHALTHLLTQVWFAARLPGLVQDLQAELIHFHTRYRGRLFYSALRRSGVPAVADLRDKMANPELLAAVADWLLCCGEGVRRFALEGGFPAPRTVLIPNAFAPPDIPSPELISDARQHYGLGEKPYVLFVGDITRNKGVYDLLEAYQRWRLEHPQVQLVLVGTNREGVRFLNTVGRIEGTIYPGHVPRQDALALMRGAEILVLPSRSEGLPTVILEALALGTKVICPPGIPEFDRHLSPFVLRAVQADAIVDALNTAWRCSALPHYPLSDHSISAAAEGLANAYSEVVKAQGRCARF